jgi:hypothetical protein
VFLTSHFSFAAPAVYSGTACIKLVLAGLIKRIGAGKGPQTRTVAFGNPIGCNAWELGDVYHMQAVPRRRADVV